MGVDPDLTANGAPAKTHTWCLRLRRATCNFLHLGSVVRDGHQLFPDRGDSTRCRARCQRVAHGVDPRWRHRQESHPHIQRSKRCSLIIKIRCHLLTFRMRFHNTLRVVPLAGFAPALLLRNDILSVACLLVPSQRLSHNNQSMTRRRRDPISYKIWLPWWVSRS
jgi:hypothetical protein